MIIMIITIITIIIITIIIITQITIITINKTYFQIYKKIINITIHCGLALQKSVPPACNFT